MLLDPSMCTSPVRSGRSGALCAPGGGGHPPQGPAGSLAGGGAMPWYWRGLLFPGPIGSIAGDRARVHYY